MGVWEKALHAGLERVLVFEDEIEVRIAVENVGTTSITYVWEIRRDSEVCVDGRHTVVHVDEDGRPAPVPGGRRAALGG